MLYNFTIKAIFTKIAIANTFIGSFAVIVFAKQELGMSIHKKKLSLICVIVMAVFAVISLAACASDAAPLYIAHRGHGEHENTKEAFRNSVDFWGIECDVCLTSDGEIVINHDSDVTFADGNYFIIAETTLETLLSQKFDDGSGICTFSEYLQICKEMEKVAVVELKSAWSENEIAKLLGEIEKYYCIDNVVIISFIESNLRSVRAQSSVQLQYLMNSYVDEKIEFCIENNITPSVAWDLIDSYYVNMAHQNNLKIAAWTVNSATANQLMKKLGVDYVTSDNFSK